ncbi:ATP-binding cassette domain-containing protein [Sporosarcina sp. BI001-red]|uniref:methionine ABC transporter ATP-binding protein n=1 Tax=Sporosarcina sp. BI001-red TaxID=2282866 RepID=UPI000E22DECC|nr:ATP-binding cassette domain-containing protein [Sporosarcina sp. BI001-red]REB08132.1 ATP-binding cassette domain-containing protein [Sporosarcina sp. BI001-red]
MISLHNVSKSFSGVPVIQSISLSIAQGDIHGIIGASGAGKSTLLRLINLLETPDSGTVEVSGHKLTALTNKQLRQTRKSIGMIFQHFNLVANKTVYENVLVALELAKYPKGERRKRALECLRFVGLEHFQTKYPAQLSGGQKQRVAIARALANHPNVLLCDEPTSSLDPHTTAEILTVLTDINQRLGVTIVLVSHEMKVIKSICNRVTVMTEGTVHDTFSITPKGIQETESSAGHLVEQLMDDGDRDA